MASRTAMAHGARRQCRLGSCRPANTAKATKPTTARKDVSPMSSEGFIRNSLPIARITLASCPADRLPSASTKRVEPLRVTA
jgi:hypothetical protein